jgi:hypothetical protein
METQHPSLSAFEFSALARNVSATADACGLKAPGFRTPSQIPDRTRSVRRLPGGSGIVSVTTRNRTADAIITDMVDGIITVNGLKGGIAASVRRTMLRSLLTVRPTQAA